MRGRLVMTVVLCLLLAGCSNSTAGNNGANSKVLRMVIQEPSSLDPNICADYCDYYSSQLFEPLYLNFTDGTQLMLGAKSIDIGADGLSLTIHLNPAYKWSDGQPVTAHDYAFSWERIMDPKSGSSVEFFLSSIKNADAYNAGKITDTSQIGIQVIDDLTLQVQTVTPALQFKKILALPFLAPVPQHVVIKAGANWTSDATIASNGPYRLVTWKHDQEIDMERNPYYGGPPPAIDKIHMFIRTITSAGCVDSFANNEVDFITEACITPPDLARIQADPTLKTELQIVPLSATEWFQFDNLNPRWQALKVRQALSLAIDRQKLTQAVTNGTGQPASVAVAKDIDGYDPSHALSGGVDQAKQLLAAAGFPGGAGFPTFSITVSASNKTPAEVAQQMWHDNLGVNSKIQVLDDNAYSTWLRQRDAKNPYDIAFTGWYTDYSDPYDWYNSIWVSDYRHAFFRDPQFLDLANRGALAADPGMRHQLYSQADAILNQQAPIIPLYTPSLTWLIKPNVHLKVSAADDIFIIGQAQIS